MNAKTLSVLRDVREVLGEFVEYLGEQPATYENQKILGAITFGGGSLSRRLDECIEELESITQKIRRTA